MIGGLSMTARRKPDAACETHTTALSVSDTESLANVMSRPFVVP